MTDLISREYRMTYRWRCTDDAGNETTGAGETFADQAEAEDWLSANWADLSAEGVSAVTLLDDDDEVYGPMSLDPAE